MMQARKVLHKLDRKYDFFENSPPIERELILNHLYPPLPVAGGCLVWGYNILKEAEKLGLTDLKAVDIEGDPPDLLCIALKLENRRDLYSWTEMAGIAEFIDTYDCSSRFKEIEELVQTTGSFLKRVRLFNNLDPGPRVLVVSKAADLKTAGKLVNFSEEACTVFIEQTGALSTSETRKLLTLINETGLREKMGQAAIEKYVDRICASDDPVRTAASLRYPTLTSMEHAVGEFKNRYVKGTGLKLELPPGFEGDTIQVSFRCRSGKDLKQKVESLQGLTDKTDELFDLLF